MKLRILLKASLMLGLVIAGRYARDVEQTNPGRSLSEILRTSAAAPALLPIALLPIALPVASHQLPTQLPQPVAPALPAQSASFTEVN